MIVSKTLYHTNIALIFDPHGYSQPENHVITSFFAGGQSSGVQFIDDPLIHAKFLNLPEKKIRIVLEKNLFRIEDHDGLEPEKSTITSLIFDFYSKNLLNKAGKLAGFGFNMDMVLKSNQIIPIQNYFLNFFKENLLNTYDLRDFGLQFTLERSSQHYTDQYFLKILSPLEVACHVNRHFNRNSLPGTAKLEELFKNCYTESTELVENMRL